MSYKTEKDKNEYTIKEMNTDLIVYKNDNTEIVRSICRKLNLGSGFNGFTPIFFTLFQK